MEEVPRVTKRRRESVASDATTVSQLSDQESSPALDSSAASKSRSISPPASKRRQTANSDAHETLRASRAAVPAKSSSSTKSSSVRVTNHDHSGKPSRMQPAQGRPSPIQLTKVNGLPRADNVETVSLHDILGDPLIKECWAFNYLFDVDWMMTHFDEDVRNLVKVYLIHGHWRQDLNRAFIELPAQQFEFVKTITAWMPEAYGTHHTKMFILLKHDDTAQVVVLTANMLERDWQMAQAVWRSPPLPLNGGTTTATSPGEFGAGSRFKHDLLSYLRKYESRLQSLVDELSKYDFSAVKGALVASAPGKQNVDTVDSKTTLFGWPGLERVLQSVPASSTQARINIQVSSVGTLGVKDDWLRKILFSALASSKAASQGQCNYSIVFPTADEIRQAHDGYECGGSIHWKTQKPANQKQLTYMRKYLCHWAADCVSTNENTDPAATRDAGRKRANPHIKTYIRFSDDSATQIDWAMMTSANMSKQAWGEAKKDDGTVRVCSYELGVVVWPELFAEGDSKMAMVPTFKTDTPDPTAYEETVVGFRMPYDTPLVPYKEDETPWCCTSTDPTPDRHGKPWG